MEFILFLSKIDKEIIELINKSNNSIEENTALCAMDKKFVGFYKRKEKVIVICTENAKKLGGYKEGERHDNHKTNLYICLLYTSPSPRDKRQSRMPSSA